MTDEAAIPVPSVTSIEPVSATVVDAGTPLSVPYREVVETPPLEPRARSASAPTFGSSIWVAGVALWAYVVAGQLVTTVGPSGHDFLMSEGMGELFVFAASAAAWWTAFRRTLRAKPTRGVVRAAFRAVGIAALAAATWLIVTVLATAVGKSSGKNLDGAITFVLLALGAAAAIGGRYMAGFHAEGTPRASNIVRGLWIAAGVLTLFALVLLQAG